MTSVNEMLLALLEFQRRERGREKCVDAYYSVFLSDIVGSSPNFFSDVLSLLVVCV
jgi:hypothetical protein